MGEKDSRSDSTLACDEITGVVECSTVDSVLLTLINSLRSGRCGLSGCANASLDTLRIPPSGREAPVLVPPLVALPEDCNKDGPDPGRPVDLLDRYAKRERSDRPGESSLSCRQQIHSTCISEAKAATERSEGVAEAKRWSATGHQPKAEPSQRANVSSGRGRRPADMLLVLLSHRIVTL